MHTDTKAALELLLPHLRSRSVASRDVVRNLTVIAACAGSSSELAPRTPADEVMVALALCDRTFLPPTLSAEPGRELWRRLDNSQKLAVLLFAIRET